MPRAAVIPRLARLARSRSPRVAAAALRRAAGRELACVRIALGLRVRPRRVLAGPFLGEVGFELLYWIPFLNRTLAGRGIPAERVTVLTRGGAACWYRDLAAGGIEILDLVGEEELARGLAERRRRAGDAKQLTVEPFDRRLAALARERVGAATLLHPILMFARMRWIWQGEAPVAEIRRLGDYRPLPRPEEALARLAGRLPAEYVALKAYFSDCFPDTPANRAFLAELVDAVAEVAPVVVLAGGEAGGDHDEWLPAAGERVLDAAGWTETHDNLETQTALVAGAAALLSTYGGFSYLGPFLGVPTFAFRSRDGFNDRHLAVLREAFPAAEYALADAGDAASGRDFVRRRLEPAGAVRG